MSQITSSVRPRVLGAAVLLLLASAAACVGADLTGPSGANANLPVVGSSAGQFGFAITAHDWSSTQNYSPDLRGDSLQVGLAVVGYAGGTGSISIVDATDAVVFSADLAGNIASGNNATFHGTPPYRVRVTASHYTGIISIGVGTSSPQG